MTKTKEQVDLNVRLEELFPVENLKDDKLLMKKFIKEVDKRRKNELIPLYKLGSKEFYCNSDILLKQPSTENYCNDSILIIRYDIEHKEIGFVFQNKDSLLSRDGYYDPFHLYATVTPLMAWRILVYHNIGNRNIDLNRVQMYSRCMKEGKWQPISQGVSFCENGSLDNGQHRLCAIIFSGVPVRLAIASGEPKFAKLYIDEGKSRTDKDAAIMMGEEYSSKITSVIKWMSDFHNRVNKKGTLSYREERLDFYKEHCKKGIDYTFDKINEIEKESSNKDRVLNLALLKAGLARLYYNLDRYEEYNTDLEEGALERFNQLFYVLINGIPYQNRLEDNAAIYIHSQRISKKGNKEFAGNNRKAGYFMAEKCFDIFMKRKEVKKFRKENCPKEMFLLPTEKEEIKKNKNMHE